MPSPKSTNPLPTLDRLAYAAPCLRCVEALAPRRCLRRCGHLRSARPPSLLLKDEPLVDEHAPAPDMGDRRTESSQSGKGVQRGDSGSGGEGRRRGSNVMGWPAERHFEHESAKGWGNDMVVAAQKPDATLTIFDGRRRRRDPDMFGLDVKTKFKGISFKEIGAFYANGKTEQRTWHSSWQLLGAYAKPHNYLPVSAKHAQAFSKALRQFLWMRHAKWMLAFALLTRRVRAHVRKFLSSGNEYRASRRSCKSARFLSDCSCLSRRLRR
ncbi:hypothetical protein DFH11DRAFT_1881464 [Phellopilus nigrolimitatus]|nr:hypothetical protein DFH11DRAFT_1881464 [Phellopilus nigrolimitatus]